MIVWLVPSFTAAAISVSIIGILLGPMYPIVINHAARVLPRHLVNGAVGWMSACGAGGSALLPFITGTIASHWGIESLQPLCVFSAPQSLNFFQTQSQPSFFGRLLGMMIILGLVWSIVPKGPKMSLEGF